MSAPDPKRTSTLDRTIRSFHVPYKMGGRFEPAKSVFSVRDDAVSRRLTYWFGNGNNGQSAHGSISAHAGSNKRHVSLGSWCFLALCVEWSTDVEGNILAFSLRNGRELVVYNACYNLEYRGPDTDPRPSTFGSALARNDRLFRALIAFACYDPRNYTAARRLFAV